MKSRTLRIIFPLLVLLAAIVLLMPRNSRFSYDYRQGSVWNHETLVAQFSFPLLKTPEQILSERQAQGVSSIPYYRLLSRQEQIQGLRDLPLGEVSELVGESLARIYERGVLPDEGLKSTDPDSKQELIYVQKGKRALKCPVSEVLTIPEAREEVLKDLAETMSRGSADSLLRETGIYDLITANLLYDSQMTQLAGSESSHDISPTLGFIPAGQMIVSQGEMVTAEIAQMLDSYKKEYESTVGTGQTGLLHWLGNILVALAMVLILYLSLNFIEPGLADRSNEYLYILLVVLIASVPALLLPRLNPRMIYIVPFTLVALLLQTFFGRRIAFPVYAVSLLPLLVTAQNGAALYMMFLTAGTVAILLFKYLSRRWKQFILALVTAVVLAVMYFAFNLLHLTSDGLMQPLLLLFIGSMLTVAGFPLTFLFERIFNLTSDSRLEELCNTSNRLLSQLEQRAPGTFQHSLQVMNMSDAAARSIGANPLLVRAGALYHDIGKINNPSCFVENESLIAPDGVLRYHSELTPVQSSHDITRHVEDGLELADRYGLPKVVRDFIPTHHGTTVTRYFYDRFLKEGGDPSRIDEFRYTGIKPQTREQLILMIADSIEAASRSLKDYSHDSLSALVESIVAGKMEEGQMDEAPISIKELSDLKAAFKNYLEQMFHERIAYPHYHRHYENREKRD